MPSADTTQRAALLPSDALGASSTSETQVTKSSVLVTLPWEGTSQYDKRPFLVKVWGRTVTVGASNLTVKLYLGSSTTISSNLNIGSSGAIAMGSTLKSNFYLEFECLFDSTSAIMNSAIRGYWIGSTIIAQAFGTQATAQSAVTEGQSLSLTITHSASNAGNQTIVDGFELESR